MAYGSLINILPINNKVQYNHNIYSESVTK